LDGRWLRVNRSVCELVGYSERELLATDFQTITHPDDLDADLGHVREMLTGEIQTYQMEKRYFHKQGHVVHILLSVSLVRDRAGGPLYFIAQIQDITQRKRAEEQMRESLREKEVLLKEIHHRVKNNLQIVSTLLDLQSDHTTDPGALEMFRESRGRVRSMALIHERLYRSLDLARVDFAEYVRQLVDDLYRTYKTSDDDIRLELDVDVPPLSIDIAIPCGLLLNELMSNCFKHAFRDVPRGCVRVSFHRSGDGANVLTVADDGVGFPAGIDFRTTASFGLQLVNTLVDQLDGAIDLTAGRGTTFTIRFPRPGG
jgi:PAS domain S-box-containing protein